MDKNSKGYPVTYIGDAVYACYDGYMIGLSLNHHEAEPLIWLESEMLEALERFVKTVKTR